MDPAELAYFGAVVVPVLVGIAVFFGWRQLSLLRSLRTRTDLGPEDRAYLHAQGWRRLVCSALLLVLAALLAGSFLLEGRREQVHEERVAQTAHDRSAPIQPEHRAFLQAFTAYWIVMLLVLMVLLALAFADVRAIARFGERHRRQLREDLQATLASEIARLRKQGNGRH